MIRVCRAENILNLLLVFVPLALVLEFWAHAGGVFVFLASAVAIVPLAGLMGKATEALAVRVGAGLGGFLNATFGNAAELIIAIFALRAGFVDLAKASLTGSIIGNLLLVFGLSAFLGGVRHRRQEFNRTAASMGATMLLLSVVALVVPAIFHWVTGPGVLGAERTLSVEISVVLLLTYGLGLLFKLRTHQHLYSGKPQATKETPAEGAWSPRKALSILVLAAVFVGIMSELLVEAVGEAAERLGMSEIFIGVIVVAIVGNAAEHSTAVLMALRNKMDLAMQIAVGSSVQIALFVAPALVLLSYVLGPTPMDLRFTTFEVVAVALTVFTVVQIAHDGETNWMEGVQLLAVYAILAVAFFYLPA